MQQPDLLTSSAAGSPVSPSRTPGSALARRMTATSGLRCAGLSRLSGPLGSLVRMLLVSSAWNSTAVLLTWKPSATPARRSLFRLVPSMPRTAATEYGLLPTPTAAMEAPNQRANTKGPKNLMEIARGEWDTRIPRLMPTATVGDSFGSGSRNTPQSKAHKGVSLTDYVRGDGGTGRLWPTPAACEARSGFQHRHEGAKGSQESLTTVVCKDQGLRSGSLNPQWVEILMGYPCGWTDLSDGE